MTMAEGLTPWRQETIGAGFDAGDADGEGSAEPGDGVGDGLSAAVWLVLEVGVAWVTAGDGLLWATPAEEPQALRTTATARTAHLDRIGPLGLTAGRGTGYGRQKRPPV